MTISTRLATLADAGAIAEIYNQGIEDRIATFETEPRSVEEVTDHLDHKGEKYPTIVVVRDGQLVGFAWASEYRTRPCYGGVAEHSVYVARSVRGHGVGELALTALCDAFAERGFWKLLSRIFPDNLASLRLHERCGFRVVGTYERHAQLDGVWKDCVIVEKLLS